MSMSIINLVSFTKQTVHDEGVYALEVPIRRGSTVNGWMDGWMDGWMNE